MLNKYEGQEKTFLFLYKNSLEKVLKDQRFWIDSWCKGKVEKKYLPLMNCYTFESDLGTLDFIHYDSFLGKRTFPYMYEYDSVWILDDPDFETFKHVVATFRLHSNPKIAKTDLNIPYRVPGVIGQTGSRTLHFKG